ncbi:hypothetical protein Godav_007575 [Gossypium davidsonii]|uniref:Uncharacterized protein n=1 Tax=Gossypium davidsonii TaxID=34287 RepID=A0A7J8S8Y3_GOSDV|nr:hypothetical protein [Gossypium davidsonii]
MVLTTTTPAPEQYVESSTFASRYVRQPLPSKEIDKVAAILLDLFREWRHYPTAVIDCRVSQWHD